MRTRALVISAAVALLLLAVPALASADTSFESGDVGDLISAQDGTLVYSVPSGKKNRILRGFGAASKALPIPRSEIFGLDVGTDSKGRKALAYSRCKGDRCDIYVYGFASRKSRKLKSISRSACLERNPSIVRGTVLFVRRHRKSRKRRLRCAGGIFLKRPGKKLKRIAKDEPFDLAYDGSQVVFVRVTDTGKSEEDGGFRNQVRAFKPGHRSVLLADGVGSSDRGGSDGTFLSAPALADGKAYWVRNVQSEDMGSSVTDVVRRPADASGPAQVLSRAGRLWVTSQLPEVDRPLTGIAVTGTSLYYGYGPFRIGLVAGTPAFN